MVFAILTAALALSTGADDAKEKLGPISPDRPSFANGTTIEALGHPSLEMGVRQTQLGRQTLNDIGDSALLRMALRQNFEVHLGIPSYLSSHGGGPSAKGFGEEDLGFKWRLTPDGVERRWAFAIQEDALLPTGSRNFRVAPTQPILTAIGAMLPDSQSEIDVNLVFGRMADDRGSYNQWGVGAEYDHNLGSRLDVFGELYALWPQTGRIDKSAYADTGLTYWLQDSLAVDAYFGQGLNGIARDRFFGAGISLRF